MATTSVTIPIIITASGPQPTPPATLQTTLTNTVLAIDPGFTNNLPGLLIEDISSTDLGAVTLMDSARVEVINSLTPLGANIFLLNQLGQIYGVPLGLGSNTSVYVVFSGTVGFVIKNGFTVSNGVYQYIVQQPGIIDGSGSSLPLYAVATQAGIWPVPSGSVTQLITSVPSGVTLSVTNPETGTPGSTQQSWSSYRSQVLQAGLAASQGMSRYVKTLLGNVPGVQPNLVSMRQQTGGGWEVICGGGDSYQIALAIWQSISDISTLVGSVNQATGITNANPGVVTTSLWNNVTNGSSITIAGATPTAFNGTYTATVITPTTFSIGVDTTGFGTYVSGGVVTPNARNITININDYPDTYDVLFVNPPAQTVTIGLTWNTTSTNYVSPTSVAAAGQLALANYVNNLPVGQPMNLFELQAVFQESIADIVPTPLLTRMVFTVDIDGVSVPPQSGTGIIAGDPESYFSTTTASITITQG